MKVGPLPNVLSLTFHQSPVIPCCLGRRLFQQGPVTFNPWPFSTVLQPLHLLQFFISPQSDAWNFPAHFWFPVQLDTKACLLFPCNVLTPITLCHNESVDSCPPMLKEMQDPQQVFLLSLPPLFYPQLHSIHISKMLFYICYSFVERPITWRKNTAQNSKPSSI